MAFSINQQTYNQQHKTRRHNGRLSQFYIGPDSAYDVPHFTNARAVQMLSKLRNVADQPTNQRHSALFIPQITSAFRNSALYQHPMLYVCFAILGIRYIVIYFCYLVVCLLSSTNDWNIVSLCWVCYWCRIISVVSVQPLCPHLYHTLTR